MSYNIGFYVKVEGCDAYAFLGSPEYDTPTYNLRPIFEKALSWDYKQGKYYRMDGVINKIRDGINELVANEHLYKALEPSNGWGTVKDALDVLKSIYKWFYPQNEWQREFDSDIPMNCIYMRW